MRLDEQERPITAVFRVAIAWRPVASHTPLLWPVADSKRALYLRASRAYLATGTGCGGGVRSLLSRSLDVSENSVALLSLNFSLLFPPSQLHGAVDSRRKPSTNHEAMPGHAHEGRRSQVRSAGVFAGPTAINQQRIVRENSPACRPAHCYAYTRVFES